MAFKKLMVLTTALVWCAPVPALCKGGRGGSSSSAASAPAPGTGVPVSTQQNGTFNNQTFSNPIGVGQAVPPATSTTSSMGNQVGAAPGAPIVPGSGSAGNGQAATLSSAPNRMGAGVGTAPNGLPIGSPGSGRGSPENPY